MESPASKAYFGYGSNLWQEQMVLRCPSSPYIGLGRLRGYRWFINARGYANIAKTGTETDEVWGLVYDLKPVDEARLDVNEGVPYAYEKRMIPVEFWHAGSGPPTATTTGDGGDGKSPAPSVDAVPMLVYIDFKRTSENHTPKPEYVHRMNCGIRDALKEGVPQDYVDKVLRYYIPADEKGSSDQVKGFALKQALSFEDESGNIERMESGWVEQKEWAN